MVIHEESESPVEISVIRKPAILEPKKYVMVSNHVRELPNCEFEESNDNLVTDKLDETAETDKRKGKKKAKKRKIVTSEEDSDATHISESDLSELRTIYQKCLTVINKIENKYGHLLNIEKPGCSRMQQNGQLEYKEVCRCTKNRKIVFDDDGTQHTIEVPDEDHICPTIPKKLLQAPTQKCDIEEDFEDYISTIPDDLPALSKMLHDPELSLHNRNKILQKMTNIKFDNNQEIRFNRPALIQSVKQDPSQVLGFKGVNFELIPGYL